jgi:hypothetical protein
MEIKELWMRRNRSVINFGTDTDHVRSGDAIYTLFRIGTDIAHARSCNVIYTLFRIEMETKSKGTLIRHVNKNDVSLPSGPVQITIHDSVSHGRRFSNCSATE